MSDAPVLVGAVQVTVSASLPAATESTAGAAGLDRWPYTVRLHELSRAAVPPPTWSVMRSFQTPAGSSPRCLAEPKRT